jgi:hypothetical protein
MIQEFQNKEEDLLISNNYLNENVLNSFISI